MLVGIRDSRREWRNSTRIAPVASGCVSVDTAHIRPSCRWLHCDGTKSVVSELDEARRLIEEAIRLCEANGRGIVAAHLQLALDLLKGDGDGVAERRHEWGGSE